MADGKITIETSIDNAGAIKDLNKLINSVNAQGKKSAGKTSAIFSGIGKGVGAGVKVAATAIGTMSTALVGAGGVAIKTGIEFESAFAGVKKTVDAPKEVLDELRQSLIDMSKEMPQSASELANIAEAAGQLGIETKNIGSFTKTMAQLGDSTNMAATEAADSLARFANITGMSQTNFDRLGSVIVALGNNMATTEGEITAMGMRLAGAGNQVGMTESQIMSFAAALSSVGIEAEAGGSAFSTTMSKMQLAVENGGQSLEDFASVAGISADEFKSAFQKDAAGAIISFIQGLSKCEDQGKSAIGVLDDMGITEIRQRDALLRAAGASDVFTEALQIGSDAWDENTALANEASQRYETLESKMSMMKNSASALGIQFKDSIDGQLRNAVQVGTDSINRLSDAFTNGGLDAAVKEAGDVMADLSVRVAESAPKMIQSASTLLKSFVTGISQRKGEILNAGVDIAKELAKGIADILPSSMSAPAKKAVDILAKSMKSGGLKKAAGDVVNIFKNMATLASKALVPASKALDLLADNFDKIAPIAAGAYTAIKGKGKIDAAVSSIKNLAEGVKKASTWFKTAKAAAEAYSLQQQAAAITGRMYNTQLTVGQAVVGVLTGKITLATAAQTAWNAVMNANPIGLIITAMAAAATAIGAFALITGDSESAIDAETEALKENADQIREMQQARQESVNGVQQEYGHYQSLWEELKRNVDENGKVKAGYEDRAAFITSTLANALGVEISMTDGVIDKYGELKGTIDEVIEKKRQQATLDAYYDSYQEAIKGQADANKELVSTYQNLQKAQENYNNALNKYNSDLSPKSHGKLEEAKAALDKAKGAYDNASTAANEYNTTIAGYEAAAGAVQNGSANANLALTSLTNGMKTATIATSAELEKQVETYRKRYEDARSAVEAGGGAVTEQALLEAQEAYLAATNEMAIGNGMTQEQIQTLLSTLAGKIGYSGLPEAASTEAQETTSAMSTGLAAGAPQAQSGANVTTSAAKSALQNSGLSSAAAKGASGTGKAISDKIASESGNVTPGINAMSNAARAKLSSSDLSAAAKKSGSSAGKGMADGIKAQTKNASSAAKSMTDAAKKSLTSGNLKNHYLTEARQAGQSMANGLRSQSGIVGSAARSLASSAKSSVSGLSSAGRSAGANFSAGLASGIRSGAGGVRAAAAEVARAAAAAAKANLDINSPSGVMEDVGYWYDKGLERGVRRNADGIIEAVDDLSALLLMNPRDIARNTQRAFDSNISRLSERYASAQNRIPGESAAELDYNKLAILFADRLIERLGTLGVEVNQREFARLVREVL